MTDGNQAGWLLLVVTRVVASSQQGAGETDDLV